MIRRGQRKRCAASVEQQRAMFDPSRGLTQDRLVEVCTEFQHLSSEQKALLLREAPTFYVAAARLARLYGVLRRGAT